MTKAVVIGGSGHVGTYLVPRLVEAGFDVVNVTRGRRQPYTPNGAWEKVETLTMDREAEEKAGQFGTRIAGLGGDIVIDMICFTLDSARQIAEALDGRVQHFLHTGTIWVHGPSVTVPSRALERPTHACRPNSSPPCPSLPFDASKPFSRTKTALRPPPRSSVPRMPQRLPWMTPLVALITLPPPLLLM